MHDMSHHHMTSSHIEIAQKGPAGDLQIEFSAQFSEFSVQSRCGVFVLETERFQNVCSLPGAALEEGVRV